MVSWAEQGLSTRYARLVDIRDVPDHVLSFMQGSRRKLGRAVDEVHQLLTREVITQHLGVVLE